MNTREVAWLFHGPQAKRMHRLWVPDRKSPPSLAIDAINWERPIADELTAADIDFADGVQLRIGHAGVNCHEPTRTPAKWPEFTTEKPLPWVRSADLSNEAVSEYRERLDLLRAITRAYEAASLLEFAALVPKATEQYPQLTPLQKLRQEKRNKEIIAGEYEDRRKRLLTPVGCAPGRRDVTMFFLGGPRNRTSLEYRFAESRICVPCDDGTFGYYVRTRTEAGIDSNVSFEFWEFEHA